MHDEWEKLLPDYIIDSLSERQRQQLEAHLESCETCQAALEEWRLLASMVEENAASRARPLPPLRLDGALNPPPVINDKDKGEIIMKNQPNQKGSRIPYTLVAALALTIIVSMVLISIGRQPTGITPAQQVEGDVAEMPDDAVGKFAFYIEQVWNQQNLDVLPALLTEDHVHHDMGVWEPAPGYDPFSEDAEGHVAHTWKPIIGQEAVVEFVNKQHTILPDVTFTVDRLVQAEDEVMGVVTLTAGDFTRSTMARARFEDGQIAEVWFDASVLVTAFTQDVVIRYYESILRVSVEGESRANVDRKWREEYNSKFFTDTAVLHNPDDAGVVSLSGSFSLLPFICWSDSAPEWEQQANIFAHGDLVFTQYTSSCVQQMRLREGWMPLEPSGEVSEEEGVFIWRIEDGRVQELWWYVDAPWMWAGVALRLEHFSRSINDAQAQAIYDANSENKQQEAIEKENKRIAELWVERVWVSDECIEVECYEELVTSPYVHNQPLTMFATSGYPTELVAWNRESQQAYPNAEWTVEHLYAEDDMVTAHVTMQGTHDGLCSFCPTGDLESDGELDSFEYIFMFRFEDGKIAEDWWYLKWGDMITAYNHSDF